VPGTEHQRQPRPQEQEQPEAPEQDEAADESHVNGWEEELVGDNAG
jgi:hypothetical protein